MKLYRCKLTPKSAWRTPWQADTIYGMLCGSGIRSLGKERILKDVIRPALDGSPRFVVSDCFPGDHLPVPESVRVADWPVGDRKRVKRAQWIGLDAVYRLRDHCEIGLDDLVDRTGFQETAHTHNSLSRATNTTADTGNLYTLLDYSLSQESSFLSLYVRIEQGAEELFQELLNSLASSGFGADSSTGKGQFEIQQSIEPISRLDAPFGSSQSVMCLSTFQPKSADPTDGFWRIFPKWGKLGPEFGLQNVFKRPLLLLKPGACFRVNQPTEHLGRCIPMDELLSEETCGLLKSQGADVVHFAFGLTIPIPMDVHIRATPEAPDVNRSAIIV